MSDSSAQRLKNSRSATESVGGSIATQAYECMLHKIAEAYQKQEGGKPSPAASNLM
ncbi:MAG: hypothetical protein AB8G99_24585 [Planctomycetaceae bacterium]